MSARANPLADEIWMPIPIDELEGYEASSFGRIRSLDRILPTRCRWGFTIERRHRGRILALRYDKQGYLIFCGRLRKYWRYSRIICTTFNGPPPTPEHEAAHWDGDKTNNTPGNLVWATPVENAAHKEMHGTVARGTRNGHARLNDYIIRLIIEEYAAGTEALTLALRYRVSTTLIRSIVRGGHWRHVESPYKLAARARAKQNMFDAPRRRFQEKKCQPLAPADH